MQILYWQTLGFLHPGSVNVGTTSVTLPSYYILGHLSQIDVTSLLHRITEVGSLETEVTATVNTQQAQVSQVQKLIQSVHLSNLPEEEPSRVKSLLLKHK